MVTIVNKQSTPTYFGTPSTFSPSGTYIGSGGTRTSYSSPVYSSPVGNIGSSSRRSGGGGIYTPPTQEPVQTTTQTAPSQTAPSQSVIGITQPTKLSDILTSPMPLGGKITTAAGFIYKHGIFGTATGEDVERKRAEERAEQEAGILRRGKWETPYSIFAGTSTVIPTKITPYTEEELGGGLLGGTGMPGGAAIVLGEREQKETQASLSSASYTAEKELFPIYQQMVTEYTTEEQLADVNKMFQKAVEKRTYETAGLKDIELGYGKYWEGIKREQIGMGIAEKLPTTALVGGAVVGTSLLLPPMAVATASIIGGTAGLVSVFRNPESISTTIDPKTMGIIKESYTLPATIKIAAYGGMVLGGAYGLARITAQEITQAQIRGVIEMKPEQVKTARFEIGEGKFIDYSKIIKDTGQAQMITRTVGYGKVGEAGRYVIVGKQESMIRTFDFWKGVESDLKIVSGQKFMGAGRMLEKGTLTAKGEWTPSLIRIKTMPSYDISSLEFGGATKTLVNIYKQAGLKTFDVTGISTRQGDIITSMSGKPTYFYKTETGFETGFKPEQLGLTKVYRVGITPEATAGATTTGKTISKLSMGDISQAFVQQAEFPTATAKSIVSARAITTGAVTTVIPKLKQEVRVEPMTKQIPVTKQIAAVIPSQVLKTRELTWQAAASTRLMQIPSVALKQFAATVPAVIPRIQQVTRQITQLTRVPITTIPPAITGFGMPTTPIIIPRIPLFPKLPQMGWGERGMRGIGLRRTFKYQPSIGAVLKGIKVPKLGKAEKFAEFTGYLPRPTITRKKLTSKKKR